MNRLQFWRATSGCFRYKRPGNCDKGENREQLHEDDGGIEIRGFLNANDQDRTVTAMMARNATKLKTAVAC